MGWIPRPIEQFIIGKIWLQPFYEGLHRISLRGMNYMQSQSIEYSGEIFALNFANSKRTKPVLLFDVGANKGDYSEAICRIFKKDFKILAFEPSQSLFSTLKSKFRTNDQISIYNFGFSDSKKRLELFDSGDLFGSVYPTNSTATKSEIIELETIDSFCSIEDIKEIYYLKIDVEGAEIDVLKGAQHLISEGKIKFIQFEFGPNSITAKIHLKDFFHILSQYKIYRIVKDGLREINCYNEILEIPITSNFLAILN